MKGSTCQYNLKKKDYYLSKIKKILMVFNKKNLKLIFN